MRLQGTRPPFRESISWIISPFKFWTATIFLHAHLQVVYYKCVKFHKNPISGLGGVALTKYMDGRTGWFLYTPPNFVCGGGGIKIRLKQYVSLRSKGRHNNLIIWIYPRWWHTSPFPLVFSPFSLYIMYFKSYYSK